MRVVPNREPSFVEMSEKLFLRVILDRLAFHANIQYIPAYIAALGPVA